MSLCVIAGAAVLKLAADAFTLDWTHSVEKTGWLESWRVETTALRLVEARVKGSGAGMEPGPDARLVEGWWVWRPGIGAVPTLRLAASDAAPQGWRLCAGGRCMSVGERAATDERFRDGATLKPCD